MKLSAVALALLESVNAFHAPVVQATSRSVGASMFEEGDIGVLPPLGVYDPLGLIEKRDMRRYEIMEIKHGRGVSLKPPLCAHFASFVIGGPMLVSQLQCTAFSMSFTSSLASDSPAICLVRLS